MERFCKADGGGEVREMLPLHKLGEAMANALPVSSAIQSFAVVDTFSGRSIK